MYDDFKTTKLCEWCKKEITVKDSRVRLCPDCIYHKADIDRVMAGKSYSLATQDDYKRVLERVAKGATTRTGPTFGAQYYKDKGLK